MMLVKDLMWTTPATVTPDTTLRDAAAKMRETDAGVLAVGDGEGVIGIITDRDIVVRALSQGRDPAVEKVADYMTPEVHACRENASIEHAAELMKQNSVSRLAVMDEMSRLAGILSFGHILRNNATAEEIAEIVNRASHRHNGHGNGDARQELNG
jgi:CBS domain-containing protein